MSTFKISPLKIVDTAGERMHAEELTVVFAPEAGVYPRRPVKDSEPELRTTKEDLSVTFAAPQQPGVFAVKKSVSKRTRHIAHD